MWHVCQRLKERAGIHAKEANIKTINAAILTLGQHYKKGREPESVYLLFEWQGQMLVWLYNKQLETVQTVYTLEYARRHVMKSSKPKPRVTVRSRSEAHRMMRRQK